MRVDSNIYISKNDAIQLHDIINSKIRDNLDLVNTNGFFDSTFNVGLYDVSLKLKSQEYIEQSLRSAIKRIEKKDFEFKKNENAIPTIIHVTADFAPTKDVTPLKNTSLSFTYFCEDKELEEVKKLFLLQFLGIAKSNLISNNKDLYFIENDEHACSKMKKDEFVDAVHSIFSKCDFKLEYTDSSFVFLLKIGESVLIDIQYKGVVNISRAEIKEIVDSAVSHIFYNYDIFDDFRC